MRQTRTMIIVWSWHAGIYGETEWALASTRYAEDRVVCRDWSAGHQAFDQLSRLARERRSNGDVMIFLHRQHGYHQDSIRGLQLARGSAGGFVRCFLFGEGSAPIYLTNDPRGLLGTSGTFSARVAYPGMEPLAMTSIADAERRELKAAHFDHIWQLYQYALRAHIFELREDLFSAIAGSNLEAEWAPGAFYEWLRRPENRPLLLRLLSFTGRLRKGTTLSRELRDLELQTGRSLLFGDCSQQLTTNYGEAAALPYRQLADLIQRHLLAKGACVRMRDLRDAFGALLAAIPEPTYA